MTHSDTPEFVVELERWRGNFDKLYAHEPDFSEIIIPAKPEGLGPMRLIMVPKEIVQWTGDKPLQGTMDALKKHFPTWQYGIDLDEAISRSTSNPKQKSSAVWVKDTQEAGDVFGPGDIDFTCLRGVSLLERMLLEADYFFEHGKHLDIEHVTICVGSYDQDDMFPCADWFEGKFCVSKTSRSSRDEKLCCRTTYYAQYH